MPKRSRRPGESNKNNLFSIDFSGAEQKALLPKQEVATMEQIARKLLLRAGILEQKAPSIVLEEA